MASKVLTYFDNIVYVASTFCVGLTNSSGRCSAFIANGIPGSTTLTRAQMARISVSLTCATSAAPTVNTPIKVYLIRSDKSTGGTLAGPIVDFPYTTAGTESSATEPTGAMCLGSIVVPATAGFVGKGHFDAYDLPPEYAVAIWNVTGQPLGTASSSQHDIHVTPMYPEAQ